MPVANIYHLGIKELRSLWRDPVMLFLISYAFTFAIYSAATAMPETLQRAPIAIVDEDRSPLSKRLVDAFYPSYFMPPVMISQAEMDARMDAGFDTFAVNIPPGFQRDVLAGRSPTIQLNVDATRMSQAFTGSGYIQTIIGSEIADFLQGSRARSPLPVDLALRARFNPELNKTWFGAVMKVIDNITMLSIILTGAALIREREHGTVEHLLVMPVTPFEIMTGKVWAMALVVLVATTGSLHFVVQGLLPLQILSGGSTPRESMPEFVQIVMLAAPNTHFVLLAQAILYRGAGLSLVWPQFVSLALIGATLFGLSLARFRKTLAAMA